MGSLKPRIRASSRYVDHLVKTGAPFDPWTETSPVTFSAVF